MQKTRPGEIIQRYYELRQKYGGGPPPAFFRKRVWGHAEAFLAWCEKSGVKNPLRFLEYRFTAAQHTGYIPKTNQLRSEKLVEVYKSEWKQGELADARAYDALKERSGTKEQQIVKALRILTPGMEHGKGHYRGREELCLAEMDFTGGFHPSSRYCPTCPMAVRCAAALYQKHGFDVVALRAGRLAELPREIAAAAIS